MSFNYLTPKKSVAEIRSSARRSESAQAVAELMFVKMAQEEQFDETTIAEHPDLFVVWDENWRGKPGEEFPEWSQPLGAHDAYDKGAKVSHNGKRWVSTTPSNVWEPGVYGWDEYVEPIALQEEPEAVAESPEESPEA